jgi:hypothetical protein
MARVAVAVVAAHLLLAAAAVVVLDYLGKVLMVPAVQVAVLTLAAVVQVVMLVPYEMVVLTVAVAAVWIMVTGVMVPMARLELSGAPEGHSPPRILETFKYRN